MKIEYLPSFRRMYKKLERSVQAAAQEREQMFRLNIFHSRINTHKLHGRLREFWAFEVDNKNRVVFEFGDKDNIRFHYIGDHSIYE